MPLAQSVLPCPIGLEAGKQCSSGDGGEDATPNMPQNPDQRASNTSMWVGDGSGSAGCTSAKGFKKQDERKATGVDGNQETEENVSKRKVAIEPEKSEASKIGGAKMGAQSWRACGQSSLEGKGGLGARNSTRMISRCLQRMRAKRSLRTTGGFGSA